MKILLSKNDDFPTGRRSISQARIRARCMWMMTAGRPLRRYRSARRLCDRWIRDNERSLERGGERGGERDLIERLFASDEALRPSTCNEVMSSTCHPRDAAFFQLRAQTRRMMMVRGNRSIMMVHNKADNSAPLLDRFACHESRSRG